MIDVILFGNGNVAIQLAKAFRKSDFCKLIQVYSRSTPNKYFDKKSISTTQDINTIKDADVYIIAISDDAIREFSKKLKFKNKLVVHTSGSVALNDLQCDANKGVFYPLQSISKQKKISFKNIPICLETENEKDYILLETLAKSISKKIYRINSEQRKSLHVSAVFVNNFTNHLYKIGEDICKKQNVDFEILKPLILETAKKIKNLSPKNAQTGPAIRKDTNTIKKHLELLNTNQQEIYTLLTNSISNSK
ncbi:MAG TPA: DUF2520 domain-containing protein [Flavobacteriaceae bacterium]|nr:DUF2520 domain-containing protein [Flavobacteriaceae bacterium]